MIYKIDRVQKEILQLYSMIKVQHIREVFGRCADYQNMLVNGSLFEYVSGKKPSMEDF